MKREPGSHPTRVRLDDPRLAWDPDPATARKLLLDYVPGSDEQGRTRARMLAFLQEHPDALHRTCLAGHLTASALIVDAAGERALLTHHKKLGRWLQLGGHCDGDANLPAVALREGVEESGIRGLAIDPRPIDLDVHVIPARPGEPEHLHLDTRFVIHAPPGAVPEATSESFELRWFTPAEIRDLGKGFETDGSVSRLFDLVFDV